jgi:hypothetical protein
LNQPVGQGRFTVVDVGDDREIADLIDFCWHSLFLVERSVNSVT